MGRVGHGPCVRGRLVQLRGPPMGLWGTGIRLFISGEQGNKSLKLKGTGEQRQFWGTGNIKIKILI